MEQLVGTACPRSLVVHTVHAEITLPGEQYKKESINFIKKFDNSAEDNFYVKKCKKLFLL